DRTAVVEHVQRAEHTELHRAVPGRGHPAAFTVASAAARAAPASLLRSAEVAAAAASSSAARPAAPGAPRPSSSRGQSLVGGAGEVEGGGGGAGEVGAEHAGGIGDALRGRHRADVRGGATDCQGCWPSVVARASLVAAVRTSAALSESSPCTVRGAAVRTPTP